MVTGKPAFSGEETSTILKKHLRDPLVPPDHIKTSISKGFSDIVCKCMAKKANQRYVSTTDLLEDLRAVASGQVPQHIDQPALPASTAVSVQASDDTLDETVPNDLAPSLITQPLFWVALLGWILAVILFFILLFKS